MDYLGALNIGEKIAAAISRTPSVEKVLDTRREVVSML